MSKVQWKGGTLLAPVPATLVTSGTMEHPGILTVAWTGILCSDPPKTYISVRPSRYSHHLIRESGEFVINLTTAELARVTDACGVLTGAKVDKFAKFGLHREAANTVSCPTLAEAPVSLECRVTDVIPLGSHDMFLADITAVDIDPSLIDDGGKLHLERAHLLAYSHGEYFSLGKKLGSFGFSVKKKKPAGKPSSRNAGGKASLNAPDVQTVPDVSGGNPAGKSASESAGQPNAKKTGGKKSFKPANRKSKKKSSFR